MIKECCCCQTMTDKYFTVGSKVSFSNALCKDCAAELGYNVLTAGLTNNLAVLKKYAKIHPEEQKRYDSLLLKKGQAYLDAKKEIQSSKENLSKHLGCKKKEQKKGTCKSCGESYYFSIDDEAISVANLFIGNYYTLNQVKDFKKCPKCGSHATEIKKVYFWVDKKGNCVDVEE